MIAGGIAGVDLIAVAAPAFGGGGGEVDVGPWAEEEVGGEFSGDVGEEGGFAFDGGWVERDLGGLEGRIRHVERVRVEDFGGAAGESGVGGVDGGEAAGGVEGLDEEIALVFGPLP